METSLALILAACTFVAGAFLRPYFGEKGKNVATKADIGEITGKIEAVKGQHAREQELLRALLQSRSRILDLRYQREFEILETLAEHVVNLRDAAMSLRPVADFVPVGGRDERDRERLTAFEEKARALYAYVEPKQPFFPASLYAVVRELSVAARMEAIDFAHRSPEEQGRAEYWEEARRNAATIHDLAQSTLEAIRERAHVWELPPPNQPVDADG